MRPRARQEIWAFVELTGATSLALAQPVLDTFRNGADIFVLRRAGRLDILLFTLAVVLVPPLVLYLLELGAGLARSSIRPPVHAGFLGIAGALVVRQVLLGSFDAPTAVTLPVTLAVGLGVAALYLAFEPAKSFARFLGLAPLAFVLLFLASPPVRAIAFTSGPGTLDGVEVEDPAPVVMLVFDEFPTASLLDAEGEIDAIRFPNIARLAGTSTWYRNHTGVSPTTPQAVPPLLTGRYPRDMEALPISTAHPDNLFTLLEGSYDLNVWEQATQLCPPDTCPPAGTGEPTGVVPLLEDALDIWADRLVGRQSVDEEEPFKVRQSDPAAPDRAERFVESLGGDDGDTTRLDFLHALMPHQPWRYLPSLHRYNGPFIAEGLNGRYEWRTQELADAGRQRHLLQLEVTDRAVGQVLDRLEDEGRLDESLLVMTADHGVAFSESFPIRGLAEGNESEIMWTPLFVKEPGQTESVVDDQPMTAVDVLPTIADILGVEIPWDVDGAPASQERSGPDQRRYYRWEGFSEHPLEPGEDYAIIDGEAGFAALLAREAVTADDDPDLQHYRFGRWGDLVGTDPAELTQGEPTPLRIALDDPDDTISNVELDWSDVDLDQDVLPTYVSGTVSGGGAIDVVVVVNGVIGGWGESFTGGDDEGDQRSWFALVPESLLRDGENRVEVYAVTGTPDDPVLHPIVAP